ncbi:hypothetical protein F5883DRAFT_138246 [Diaporthe sp. PMI_573]|nr:hypothetical protein F5883DRAFT_138246 [Diaporthaceae sp. PMI_573]
MIYCARGPRSQPVPSHEANPAKFFFLLLLLVRRIFGRTAPAARIPGLVRPSVTGLGSVAPAPYGIFCMVARRPYGMSKIRRVRLLCFVECSLFRSH